MLVSASCYNQHLEIARCLWGMCMPMSASAYEGLRAAVAYNPLRAREFLDIMRSFPAMVKRKPDDDYGPLILMLSAVLMKVAPLSTSNRKDHTSRAYPAR